ncbi:pseudouridine synthase [Falsirhodobacter sp. alg1]|uniref:pseudouridine synthase n=1 Tax=Falsirhodobacter sp. alg1 TaxID=1472418 RepID=UPI0005EDCC3D|nr:pseudouridine synthase [Falsirhodobacter sp. alg1]
MTFVYVPPIDPPVILHEDARIIVVDKPSGLLSVPGRGEDKADCLIARLAVMFPDVLLVHRLDLDTSGVMVFARDKETQVNLSQQFEKRLTKKLYVARLHGSVAGESGTVDLPLIVDWPNRPRQHVNHETGRPSQTDWQVTWRSDTETRVNLMPVTGRTHQLRVHMMAMGHPILGDPLYAEPSEHTRLMLHAELLRLRHPDTGRSITFTAPAPF